MDVAQLVKLFDYISRYESNPFHYPSQYIRLKQENWQKLQAKWESEVNEDSLMEEEVESTPKRAKWIPFKRSQDPTTKQHTHIERPQLPTTYTQLKHFFLNQLYPIQLKWATSTISHESFTKVSLRDTEMLKYFLQRFPDIYFLMYHPVFNIKKSPIDGEIILISPFDIEIISLIHEDAEKTMIATDDRKWTIESKNTHKSMLSPVISLKRTEQIVKSILQARNVDMPVKKSIISFNNHILYATEPYQTKIFDKKDYEKWFEAKRAITSSLKSVQLKAMEALLDQCQTSAVRRPEWKHNQSADHFHNPEEY